MVQSVSKPAFQGMLGVHNTAVRPRNNHVGMLAVLQAKLTPRKGMLVRTMDVGGAGP
jgi:hypothetical protein